MLLNNGIADQNTFQVLDKATVNYQYNKGRFGSNESRKCAFLGADCEND